MPSTITFEQKYLIIIPVYNSENFIDKLLERISALNIPFTNLLFINDGSTDNSLDKLKSYKLSILNNTINKGKGYSLKKSFKYVIENYSSCDFVITMDSDLQHEPEFIPDFIKEYNRNKSDIIIGNRLHDTSDMPMIRIFSNKLTSYFVSKVCGVKIKDSQSGYRLISTKVLKNINLITNNYETESELLLKSAKQKFSISFIPISTIYGDEKSSIRHFNDTFLFLKMYFNFLSGKL